MEFVCNDPGVLQSIYIVKEVIKIAYILAPIILIVKISIDVFKEVINKGEDFGKTIKGMTLKFIALAVMFLFIPLYNGVLDFASIGDAAYTDCIDNSNPETIAELEASASILDAITAVAYAEESLTRVDYEEAVRLVNRLTNLDNKGDLQNRLDKVLEEIERIEKLDAFYYIIPGSNIIKEYGDINPSKSLTAGYDPMSPIIYNENLGLLNAEDFIYMSDENGKDLGVWPKNYNDIPLSVPVKKTYPTSTSYDGVTFSPNAVGEFIWPVDVSVDSWVYSNNHQSIDINGKMGEPIYSPVSGTLNYSEWGHTINRGPDETQFSIKITLDEVIYINGTPMQHIFLTHMSGILQNCATDAECDKRVEQGELLGFVGNAGGDSATISYATHLHMTFCYNSGCGTGFQTLVVEDLYEIVRYDYRKAGE